MANEGFPHAPFYFVVVDPFVTSQKDAFFDAELLHLSGTITAQSVVKHFLMEGDKLLISRLSLLEESRWLCRCFQLRCVTFSYGPVAADSRLYRFSRCTNLISAHRGVLSCFFSKSLSVSPSSGENEDKMLKTAIELLSTILLLFTHFLLLLVTFGPPYLTLATALVLLPQYLHTSAPSILRTYRSYLPAMAYNGILEALFASVCTRRSTIPEPYDGHGLPFLNRGRYRRIAVIRLGRYCTGVGQYREHGRASAIHLAICPKILRREGTTCSDELEQAGAAMGHADCVSLSP